MCEIDRIFDTNEILENRIRLSGFKLIYRRWKKRRHRSCLDAASFLLIFVDIHRRNVHLFVSVAKYGREDNRTHRIYSELQGKC